MSDRENIWTVPNMFCTMRIILAPYIAYLIVEDLLEQALAVVCVAGVTDFLDGWIARTFPGQASSLGSFLDPLADKVLVITLFVTLSFAGLIPLVLTVLVVARDVVLIIAGVVVRVNSLPPPRSVDRLLDFSQMAVQLSPTFTSKVNTAVQLITVVLTLTNAVLQKPCDNEFILFFWALTAVTTLVSGVHYIFARDTVNIISEEGPK